MCNEKKIFPFTFFLRDQRTSIPSAHSLIRGLRTKHHVIGVSSPARLGGRIAKENPLRYCACSPNFPPKPILIAVASELQRIFGFRSKRSSATFYSTRSHLAESGSPAAPSGERIALEKYAKRTNLARSRLLCPTSVIRRYESFKQSFSCRASRPYLRFETAEITPQIQSGQSSELIQYQPIG
ncbi:hypothetical protein CDAR_107631 [Caerostris darwini]|uniref:Uncharacterized protein n=1 Tax=Caerostris darwini TaxID=1538125 RepID=A0AAV4X3S7_9ARAC|nr:hypothetical protein CDAR_107631 [Caerostris darwini]